VPTGKKGAALYYQLLGAERTSQNDGASKRQHELANESAWSDVKNAQMREWRSTKN